jgi:hypothetical protein
MKDRGSEIFVDELTRFAAGIADGRVTGIAERAVTPLRVAVRGRSGVGCRTVARALQRAGIVLASEFGDSQDADLVVYVTAEVVKPEDVRDIAEERRPVLAVLNKADLLGFAGDGPLAVAKGRCADFAPLVGVPMEPMAALLAVAALDDLAGDLWAALRALADHPGGSTRIEASYEGFLGFPGPENLDDPVRAEVRLLDALDLFGIALAVAAVRRGNTFAQVRTLLRRVSGVDAVVAGIEAAGAGLRYCRVLDAVAELEAVAVSGGEAGERIDEFLRCDETVIARMATALDAGDALGSAARYVDRARARDIARGSLRLASRTASGATR